MIEHLELGDLRPNNWFLEKNKLKRVRQAWREGQQEKLPEIKVIEIDGELSILDGHCRVFAAWENGAAEISADVVSLDQISGIIGIKELYVIYHRYNLAVGNKYIWDLGRRIYDSSDTIDPNVAVLIESIESNKRHSSVVERKDEMA